MSAAAVPGYYNGYMPTLVTALLLPHLSEAVEVVLPGAWAVSKDCEPVFAQGVRVGDAA